MSPCMSGLLNAALDCAIRDSRLVAVLIIIKDAAKDWKIG